MQTDFLPGHKKASLQCFIQPFCELELKAMLAREAFYAGIFSQIRVGNLGCFFLVKHLPGCNFLIKFITCKPG